MQRWLANSRVLRFFDPGSLFHFKMHTVSYSAQPSTISLMLHCLRVSIFYPRVGYVLVDLITEHQQPRMTPHNVRDSF